MKRWGGGGRSLKKTLREGDVLAAVVSKNYSGKSKGIGALIK